MTNTFTIESSNVGTEGERATLTLGPYVRGSFLAEVRRDRLHATADIVSRIHRGHPSDGLADFFAGLATDWKGWTGQREWSSFENDLRLSAESPRGGGVHLRVRLNHGAPPYWQLDFGLGLEPGQLERLAAESRGFEQSARSAT
jgi:Family of unknown function (DUF6228)